MKHLLKTTLACALAGISGAGAQAAELTIQVTIPRIDATEYHRPYLAVWLESADKKTVRDITVWYEQKNAKNEEGKKYLKDLRQWWRVSGRSQGAPADGVSGATRAAGVQTIRVDSKQLAGLPAGDYELSIEAAREKGGRELLRLPLAWPPTKAETQTVQGQHELGAVEVKVAP